MSTKDFFSVCSTEWSITFWVVVSDNACTIWGKLLDLLDARAVCVWLYNLHYVNLRPCRLCSYSGCNSFLIMSTTFQARRMVIHFHTHPLVFFSHSFSSRERMCTCVARMYGVLLLLRGYLPLEAEYCALMLPSTCNYGNQSFPFV